MMPAMPAPMIATFIVSGIGTVRGSVGCDSWKPPCSSSSGTNSSSTSEPSATGSNRANNSGSSAGTASGAGRAKRVDDRHHERLGRVGIGDAGPFGRVGDVRDLGREGVDHRRVAGELRQHRDQNARVGLAQVVPQFVGVRRAGPVGDVDSVAAVMTSSIEADGQPAAAVCLLSGTPAGAQTMFH